MTCVLRIMEIMIIIIITTVLQIGQSVSKINFSPVCTADCHSVGIYDGKHLTAGSDVTLESAALESKFY